LFVLSVRIIKSLLSLITDVYIILILSITGHSVAAIESDPHSKVIVKRNSRDYVEDRGVVDSRSG